MFSFALLLAGIGLCLPGVTHYPGPFGTNGCSVALDCLKPARVSKSLDKYWIWPSLLFGSGTRLLLLIDRCAQMFGKPGLDWIREGVWANSPNPRQTESLEAVPGCVSRANGGSANSLEESGHLHVTFGGGIDPGGGGPAFAQGAD